MERRTDRCMDVWNGAGTYRIGQIHGKNEGWMQKKGGKANRIKVVSPKEAGGLEGGREGGRQTDGQADRQTSRQTDTASPPQRANMYRFMPRVDR